MIGPATAAVPASYRGYRTPEMEHREHQPKVAAGRSATWQETGSTYPYKSVHPRRTVTYTTRLALPRHGSASGLATLKPRFDPRNKNAELARRYGTLACADTRALSALPGRAEHRSGDRREARRSPHAYVTDPGPVNRVGSTVRGECYPSERIVGTARGPNLVAAGRSS